MTPEEFCRWLQGFCELTDTMPSDKQWSSIKKHLQTVFVKVTDKNDEDLRRTVQSMVNHGPTRIC